LTRCRRRTMLHGKQDRELEDDGASLKSFTGRPVSRHREFPQTSSHGENLGLIIIIGSCKAWCCEH